MNNPDEVKDRYIKIHSSKNGLRGRVDANCIACLFDPCEPGTWRAQVEACTVISCPLYPVRAKKLEKSVDSLNEEA